MPSSVDLRLKSAIVLECLLQWCYKLACTASQHPSDHIAVRKFCGASLSQLVHSCCSEAPGKPPCAWLLLQPCQPGHDKAAASNVIQHPDAKASGAGVESPHPPADVDASPVRRSKRNRSKSLSGSPAKAEDSPAGTEATWRSHPAAKKPGECEDRPFVVPVVAMPEPRLEYVVLAAPFDAACGRTWHTGDKVCKQRGDADQAWCAVSAVAVLELRQQSLVACTAIIPCKRMLECSCS